MLGPTGVRCIQRHRHVNRPGKDNTATDTLSGKQTRCPLPVVATNARIPLLGPHINSQTDFPMAVSLWRMEAAVRSNRRMRQGSARPWVLRGTWPGKIKTARAPGGFRLWMAKMDTSAMVAAGRYLSPVQAGQRPCRIAGCCNGRK